MKEHEYAISRELFDFAWNSQVVKCLQSGLALVVFNHIILETMSQMDRKKKTKE